MRRFLISILNTTLNNSTQTYSLSALLLLAPIS